MAKSLASGYQNSTHKTPDTSPLVRLIATRARVFQLQEYVADRNLAVKSQQVLDIHRVGYTKFDKTSLAIFNKKILDYKLGLEIDSVEVDELPATDFDDAPVAGEDISFELDTGAI